MFNNWSRFYNFSDVYEYYGHFAENTDNSRRSPVEFEGRVGRPHSDGGFRLRSTLGGGLSFSNRPLVPTLEEVPCPLNRGVIGCYFIRVNVNGEKWDYIGKSAEMTKGISDRLREHLIKIAGTESIHHVTPTTKFTAMNKSLRETGLKPNTPGFFQKHVSIAFVKVDPDLKTVIEAVSKVEGMALALYAEKNGDFPNLNDTDETRGLTGLVNLLT